MLRFEKSAVWALLLPASLACTSATARAADSPSAPAARAPSRSSADAKFQRYLLSPRGDVDGVLLADGSIARFAPHALVVSELASLQPGDSVHIEGDLRTGPTGRVLTDASVLKGNTVIARAHRPPPPANDLARADAPPDRKKHRPPPPDAARRPPADEGLTSLTITGKVDRFSLDPDGKIDGLVMQDGTSARVGKDAELEPLRIARGDTLTITGRGGTYTLGKALHIETIRLPSGKLETLEPQAPAAAPPPVAP